MNSMCAWGLPAASNPRQELSWVMPNGFTAAGETCGHPVVLGRRLWAPWASPWTPWASPGVPVGMLLGSPGSLWAPPGLPLGALWLPLGASGHPLGSLWAPRAPQVGKWPFPCRRSAVNTVNFGGRYGANTVNSDNFGVRGRPNVDEVQ